MLASHSLSQPRNVLYINNVSCACCQSLRELICMPDLFFLCYLTKDKWLASHLSICRLCKLIFLNIPPEYYIIQIFSTVNTVLKQRVLLLNSEDVGGNYYDCLDMMILLQIAIQVFKLVLVDNHYTQLYSLRHHFAINCRKCQEVQLINVLLKSDSCVISPLNTFIPPALRLWKHCKDGNRKSVRTGNEGKALYRVIFLA